MVEGIHRVSSCRFSYINLHSILLSFLEKYICHTLRDNKKDEFTNPDQGSMTYET